MVPVYALGFLVPPRYTLRCSSIYNCSSPQDTNCHINIYDRIEVFLIVLRRKEAHQLTAVLQCKMTIHIFKEHYNLRYQLIWILFQYGLLEREQVHHCYEN